MPRRIDTARLLISCPDRPGIVAEVSRHLFEQGANIVASDQHSSDPEGGRFFMRMVFTHHGEVDRIRDGFRFDGDWRIAAARPKRMAVLASREDHCLLDLLWRHRRGELEADIPLVIANHPEHEADVVAFGIPYHHVPWPAEERMLELLRGRVDLVVLARYMRILSGEFLDALAVPVINIHHSFLPAFAGAQPYRRAFERGVKVIGATAHYVIEELDAGPIIAQDVAHVSHRDGPDALERIGRDVERLVLARAVKAHLEDRVLVDGGRTVVF